MHSVAQQIRITNEHWNRKIVIQSQLYLSLLLFKLENNILMKTMNICWEEYIYINKQISDLKILQDNYVLIKKKDFHEPNFIPDMEWEIITGSCKCYLNVINIKYWGIPLIPCFIVQFLICVHRTAMPSAEPSRLFYSSRLRWRNFIAPLRTSSRKIATGLSKSR